MSYASRVLFLCFISFAMLAKENQPLVNVIEVIPNIVLDIRYATENNFTGKQIYKSAECYLLKRVAAALMQVQKELNLLGIGLKIWDGYRPLSAQWKLWNIVPDERYVSDPRKGGRHTRGTAIDVTLIHLATNQELEMPTPFDDFSKMAWHSYTNLPEKVLQHRTLLKETMEKYGFSSLETEWWHYDYIGWQNYPVLDTTFEELDQ